MMFQEIHGKNLPTVRIAEIKLENFKSVASGSITCNCGRKYIPYGTHSDIIGLYGQNGSGKTSLIEAVSILRFALRGVRVPAVYCDCIDVSSEYASLSFVFDFQYPEGNEYESNGDIRKVFYSFKIAKIEAKEQKKTQILYDEDLDDFMNLDAKWQIKLYDEVLQVSGTINGQRKIKKPFCDTSLQGVLFGPTSKAKLLIGDLTDEKRVDVKVNKRFAETNASSFVFMKEMMDIYALNSNYSPYYQMLLELQYYAKRYLCVVDNKSMAFGQNMFLPIYSRDDEYVLPLTKAIGVPDDPYKEFCEKFDSLSIVLEQIVPGLTVKVHDYGVSRDKDGDEIHKIELMANRGEKEIPLRCESDGVRKIISTLLLLISAYNEQSVTVAYDEFDSGIFEYLLGEILQVFQSSGKGQLIFTSHNLRPLEVLDKDSIWFTTTDPDNRYTRLTGIAETNNLRKVYYREIALQEHYDNLYNETKRHKIISAMRKAGGKC